MSLELCLSPFSELSPRLERRELSPVELTRAVLERIEALQPRLHAYVTVLADGALADAQRAEAEIAVGRYRGPLHGVPIAVKDLCATKGVPTTCGMPLFSDRLPERDAAVVTRLRDAGAVLLGKLAMTEGAYSNHHPDVATPINPWNADRWTGVSSSGSGVATAAGLCFGSLGSDTGGSIRFPSACCGVVGLKPTWGRVPLSDVFPLANSLDHVGPMTRSVRDAAHMLGVLAGFDAGDPASRREPVPDYAAEIAAGIDGVRIGVDESFAYEQTDPGLESFVRAAVDVLGESGARVVPVRMPPFEELVASWVRVTAAEVALAHEPWFPAHADRYGPALRALLELGATVSAPEYARACELRRAFSGRLAALFEDVDLLALPSFSGPAPPQALFSAPIPVDAVSDLLRLTAPFDFSGSPTLSLPCGLSEDGLPFSLQLVGRHLEESLLFRAGLAFEAETNWHALHPPV